MPNEKLKFAFYWAASCGGCEIAVLDVNEAILDVVAAADIVFWPVAMDIKYKDVEAMADKSIDVCFFNGAIRTSENEHLAKLMRQKSKVLVAFGSCAHEGGVPGLANVSNRNEIFETVYLKSCSTNNPGKIVPQTSVGVKEGTLSIPRLYDTVKPLNQVVDVDYYLPGCPPPAKRVAFAIGAIVKGELPPKGSVLAPERSVCDECPRKREEKKIAKINRVYEIVPEPEKCLLEQGIICYGPATRGGCDAQCIDANMPCTGCGGPCPNAIEQGSAMISALASIMGIDSEKETSFDPKKLMDQVKDPIGTFYKYSLAGSILQRKVKK
ncbi:MAG: F420-non-reducing hydrogenase small subunit [Thermoproteota archaeon]|nr:F420-non-reducing hydrogenase small subunit [Thermoproteota archaeon]